MELAHELAELFRRDIIRLEQEIDSFPDDASLWKVVEGVTNSSGNLALHLEGNLREYVGRQLGQVPYVRTRDLEFSSTGLSIAALVERVRDLREVVANSIYQLSDAELDRTFPSDVLGKAVTTRQFLLHLFAHFSYHLGQIDYLRRILSKDKAIDLARL